MIADIEMSFLLAGFIDKQELFIEILDDFIELGPVLDEFEHLLVDFADID
jgi:hypothetical protein